MEYNLEKKLIPGQATSLDSVQEQPIDIDFTLPDYCPDIEKILKCSMQPKIFSRSLIGGQLQVDGTAIVKVLYVDSINRHIRAAEQTMPFSASFSAKTIPNDYIILTNAKVEYLNCRALSPRRLAIHGAFSLYARIEEKSGVYLSASGEDTSLETCTKQIKCSSLTAFSQDLFSLSEEISIQNKPKIEVLLRDSLKAVVTNVKVIQDKIIVKGDLNLKILYLADIDTGEVEQIDYLVPFNQILDAQGINEETDYDLQVEILSYDIRLKSDPLAENPLVILDYKMSCAVLGYESSEESIMTDVYSTEFVTSIEKESVMLTTEIGKLTDSFIEKGNLELEETVVSKVIDVYNEYCAYSFNVEGKTVDCTGKVNACILALDEENTPVYLEKVIEFSRKIEVETEISTLSNAKAELSGISYRLTDENSIEIRTEIEVSAKTMCKTGCNCITEVVADEEKRIEKRKSSLTLYFAEKNEEIWDIAKRYNTRVKHLTEENCIEASKLESAQMLLIPTV